MTTARLTAATPLEQVIFTDYYHETIEAVRATCRAFRRKHGGDLGDYYSEAHLAMYRCFSAFQKGMTPTDNLEQQVKRFVWFDLFETYRKESRVRTANPVKVRTADSDVMSQFADPYADTFDRADLSPEACTALDLVFDGVAKTAGGLKQALTRKGWAMQTIANVFDEIAAVL